MQVPPRPPDYAQVSPPAQVEPAPPDLLKSDLTKVLREAARAVGSDDTELYEIPKAWAERNKLRDELRAATDELNEEKGRPVLDRRPERRR